MQGESEHPVLADLLMLLVDGRITEVQAAQLRQYLKASAAARRYYFAYMASHAMLEQELHGRDVGFSMPGEGMVEDEDGRLDLAPDLDSLADEAVWFPGQEGVDEEGGSASFELISRLLEEERHARQLREEQSRESERREQPTPRHLSLIGGLSEPIRPVHHIVIPRALFYGGIAAVLAVAFALIWSMLPDRGQQIATLEATRDAAWANVGMQPVAGAPLTSQPMHLERGMARVRFSNGALMIVRAPATFQPVAGDRVRITSGDVLAHCPPGSEGFAIETPSALFVDRGTEFGVSVAEDGQAEVHVFDGLVDVAADHRRPHDTVQRLARGEARRVVSQGAEPQIIEPDGSRFSAHAQWRHGVASVAGSVRFEPTAPPDLGPHRVESSRFIRVFPEQLGVSTPEAVEITIDRPGFYDDFQLRNAMLPAGTRVDSVLLHFDPDSQDHARRELHLSGSVTFDRPIVGIIANGKQLGATDELFGSPDTAYGYGRENAARGLNDGGRDMLTLSDDRRSIAVTFSEVTWVDQVRVLVAVDDEAGRLANPIEAAVDAIVWSGGDGEFLDSEQWIGGRRPEVRTLDHIQIHRGRIRHTGGSMPMMHPFISEVSDAFLTDWILNTRMTMHGGRWEQIADPSVHATGGHAIRIGDGGTMGMRRHAQLIIHDGAVFSTGVANRLLIGTRNAEAVITIHRGGLFDAGSTQREASLAPQGDVYAADAVINIAGGTMIARDLMFGGPVWAGTNRTRGQDDGPDAKAPGRAMINISGGGQLILIGPSARIRINNNADHRIDFVGVNPGGITSSSTFESEYGTQNPVFYNDGEVYIGSRPWQWAYEQGYLLRNGASEGRFDDHFVVIENDDGTFTLTVREEQVDSPQVAGEVTP